MPVSKNCITHSRSWNSNVIVVVGHAGVSKGHLLKKISVKSRDPVIFYRREAEKRNTLQMRLLWEIHAANLCGRLLVSPTVRSCQIEGLVAICATLTYFCEKKLIRRLATEMCDFN